MVIYVSANDVFIGYYRAEYMRDRSLTITFLPISYLKEMYVYRWVFLIIDKPRRRNCEKLTVLMMSDVNNYNNN